MARPKSYKESLVVWQSMVDNLAPHLDEMPQARELGVPRHQRNQRRHRLTPAEKARQTAEAAAIARAKAGIAADAAPAGESRHDPSLPTTGLG